MRKPGLPLLLACLITLVVPLAVDAAEPLPPALASRAADFAPGGLGRVPLLAAVPAAEDDRAAEVTATPDDETTLLQWSRIAFQSYRDGNWEIYSMRTDGQDLRRLTDDPGADGRPSQSPAGDRIAFVSNRSGNYEIYTMRVDGSDVRQLTNDPGEDNYPAWSPDGRRIIFASDRTGSWDIVIMNADGADVRTVVGGPQADYDPTWSPDGQHIAWIRMGEYRPYYGDVWQAKPDGTEARTLTIYQPFLENLFWSPDSQNVGFDYDNNGDGFTEVWYAVPHDNGTYLYPKHRPTARLTDALMGGFSPDGEKILISEARYQKAGADQYAFVGASLGQKRLDADANAPLEPMAGSGLDMLGEWQRTENVAPVTTLRPLPRLMRSGNEFTLSWNTDEYGSGIAGYDVEVLYHSGSWVRQYADVKESSVIIKLWTAGLVKFRVRGRDQVGNVEAWPSDADGQTIYYVGLARGMVHDNRHIPIPGAQIGELFQPVKEFVSDFDGSYEAYGPWTIDNLRASHPAYGPVTDVRRPSETEQIDLALPPKVNTITNGGFEDGLKNWKVVAGEPYLAGYAHSGQQALGLNRLRPMSAPNSQVVGTMITLPTDPERLTLSFFAMRTLDTMPWDRLSVTMGEEGAAQIPLELHWTDSGRFAYVWAGLEAWRGKTVILLFRADLTGGEGDARLLIDEITVGDWTTPVITKVEGAREHPGMLTVRGENFKPGAKARIGDFDATITFIDDQTLKVALNEQSPLGVRWLWVTNPGGEQVQFRVVIGNPLFLPILGTAE